MSNKPHFANAAEAEAAGHQYLEIKYVTISGAGGVDRRWTYELVEWLSSRPGCLIVGLREL